MAIFKGAGVAMITPFHEDKSVNYEELGRMLEAQVQGHTDAIIVCGTTGDRGKCLYGTSCGHDSITD